MSAVLEPGPANERLTAELRAHAFVVIAAYNEAQVIAQVVRDLREVVDHVVVVDDGSADLTGEQARAAGATVLTHLLNRGQGAALQTGITYAVKHGARYVLTFDADGQHRPDDLAALIAPIVAGEADICLGSRFLDRDTTGIPFARRLLLRAAIVFTRITSRVTVSDTHNGLRAFSRRAAAALDLQLDRMAHASEIIDFVRSSGLPYREVPVRIRYTEYSIAKGQRSSAALRVALDYLIGKVLR